MKEMVESSSAYLWYEKIDLLNLYSLIDNYEKTPYLGSHYIWGIPKKEHNEAIYKEGEMTDLDK